MTITVPVAAASRSYDILIGNGLLREAGAVLKELIKTPRALIITDKAVAKLHLPTLTEGLRAGGIEVLEPIQIEPGEQTKSLTNFEELIDAILSRAMDRRVAILALGGGVVGDLSGFAAATVLRGVDFVQVPTTLLAQVDSSVGGKTGVNSRHGKNLIGAFHQPLAVLIDPAVLETLPPRELRAGYAEAVKYGLIDAPDFFEWCEANATLLLAGRGDLREHLIAESCRAKARVVGLDETETGARALLNFGHTFAHALEVACSYESNLLHGEAVAVGLVLACRLSGQLGLCDPALAARVKKHLTECGLPTEIADTPARDVAAQDLLSHMFKDKKVQDGRLTLILTRGVGRAFISPDVPPEAVLNVLKTPETILA